jgi:dolichyl-phosphate-mannose--protein O-mannosyl transferase
MPAWTRLDTALLVAVTAVAAVIRFVGLGSPDALVFDEIFYAQNACLRVAGPEVCGLAEPLSNAHPPLGEWLIAAGIAVLGYDPFGWRFAAALAGTLTVALAYVLARVVLAGAGPRIAAVGAAMAAGLLAIDVLHVVMSRVAMLDVFLALFVAAAFLAVTLDLRSAPRPRRGGIGQWLFGRPWRLAAGVLIGAAVAVKWSGVYSALGVMLLVVAWEVVQRRNEEPERQSWGRAFGTAVRSEGLRTVLLLGVIPVLVYLVTYIGVAEGALVAAPWREGSWFYDVAHHQLAMARFHVGLEGQHPYESPPWSWFLLKRPVAFWFTDVGGSYDHILSMGSPLAWWPALAVVSWLGFSWLRGNRDLGASVVLVGALSAYLPWLILGFARSQVFLWYVLPALPFLYAAVGIAVTRWRGWTRGLLVLIVAAAVAGFLFFWPIATASPLSPDDWRLRMWFTDCERPGAPTLELPDDTINTGPPPDGWCWI